MSSPRASDDAVESGAPADAAESIAWTVFLLERSPFRGIMALGVVAFTGYFVWCLTESSWLTGVATFILIASLSTFFFPTRFRLDAETIRVRNLFYWRTRGWDEFRGMRRNGNRIKLVTFSRDSRLDNYRGMLLILPDDPNEGEAVLDYLRGRLEERRHESAE